MTRKETIEQTRIFEECGCCGQLHPSYFWGDCRDDEMRFTWEEIPEEKIRWMEEE